MTNIDIEENKELINDKIEKTYKTKDYVRRAANKYKKKKYAEDPEFRQKHLESSKKSQQKNSEKYREYRKNYMREYRAKKKAEQHTKNNETETILTNELSTLKIDK